MVTVRVYNVDTEHWNENVIENEVVVEMVPLRDIKKLIHDNVELDYKR